MLQRLFSLRQVSRVAVKVLARESRSLLTNAVLHLDGYGLKGLYSLEEYYAKNLGAYYEAIAIGLSHNDYFDRANADITPWIDYFCEGMARSFEAVAARAEQAASEGIDDNHLQMRALNPMKRRCLELFQTQNEIASGDIQAFFNYRNHDAERRATKFANPSF